VQSAALYARVSTAEQVEGHSVDAQLETLQAYAKEHLYQVYDEYVDPGFQGDAEDRPALRRLISDARNQKFNVVLVYRFDRFFRDVRLFLNTDHELRQHGIRLISITEAIDDTHEGRLQLLIKGSFAEYEKAVIRERANMGRMRAAKEGKWMGGPPPYGYNLDPTTSKLVINEEEAKWVQKFFEWLVHDRLSLRQLQQRVNDLGVPTRWENLGRHRTVNRKGWWMKQTLGRMLTRELYVGIYHYRKIWKPRAVKRKDAKRRPEEEWITIKVPPIIDEQLFRLAQLQLKKNSELSPRRTNKLYLLRRLLECGTCGRAWIAGSNNFGSAYYICSGRRKGVSSTQCHSPSISASKLEPAVWENIVSLLQNPELVLMRVRKRLDQQGMFEKKEQDLRHLSEQIQRAEREEGRLIQAYKEGVIDLGTLKLEREETRERLSRLHHEREKLASELTGWLSKDTQLAAVTQLSREVMEILPEISYERQCKIVHEIVERIIVRENELEIHTRIPGTLSKGEIEPSVGLRSQPGMDDDANHRLENLPLWSIDPANAIRITLFADLPPARPAITQGSIRKLPKSS
jgi:site-specific DNA recombinase